MILDMDILVVGGTGTIGSAVVDALRDDHAVTVGGHTSGDVQLDLADPASIRACLDDVGPVDAILCCAGEAAFGPLDDLTDDDFDLSLSNKLMGQVNLVRHGHEFVRDDGAITLTGGVLAQEPMEGSAAISLVNAGLEGFVRAAALEMPRGLRVNVVSPPWVDETLAAMGADHDPSLPAAKVAPAYVQTLTGSTNGAVIDPRDRAA